MLVCPVCEQSKGFNTGEGKGQLTCSNCNSTFDVDKLVEKQIKVKCNKCYSTFTNGPKINEKCACGGIYQEIKSNV